MLVKTSIFAVFFIFSWINPFEPALAAEVNVGPWIRGRKQTYRYVTEYTIRTIKAPLIGFPWIEEDCYDSGNRFANWAKSISYEIRYAGALDFSLLGFLGVELGADRSKTIEFTFQRWVTPTEGLRARHRLMENFEIWEGSTSVEFQSPQGIVRTEQSYPFLLEKMNYGISVDRELLHVCGPSEPSPQ